MKKGRKKRLAVWLLALLAVLCAGCGNPAAVEEMFTLPQPPIEYTGLAGKIEEMISAGYEYASPTAGSNIQSVQMVDLNGDNRPEAVVFLRKPSDKKPLKIMVFSPQEETYSLYCTIESSGTAVDRVEYADMDNDGARELIVGWKISADLQTVAVYAVRPEPVALVKSSYTRYSIQDMDGNGVPSLLVFRTADEGVSIAEFYGWRKETMEMIRSCVLSSTMAELNNGSIVHGKMNNDLSAVYVTGVNEQGMAVTDILVGQPDGTLINAALNRNTGRSGIIYPYRQIKPQDINGDGCTDIPAPAEDSMPSVKNDGMIRWIDYDSRGRGETVASTYHCLSSGWYFTIPETWERHVNISAAESGINEKQVVFYLDEDPVMAICAITGENRENKALRGNRIVLKRQSFTVYSGELLDGAADWDVTEDMMRDHFNLIVESWAG